MVRTCKKIQNDLVAYQDKELPPAKAQAIEVHLQNCALCAQELSDLQASLGLLLAWNDIAPSADYDRRFWQKICSHEDHRVYSRSVVYVLRAFFARHVSLATSVAFALLLVLSTFFLSKSSPVVKTKDSQMIMHMDLFRNMEVIEREEALENFEIIAVLDQLEHTISK